MFPIIIQDSGERNCLIWNVERSSGTLVAILLLSGTIVFFTWLAWRRKYRTRPVRVLYSILAVSGVRLVERQQLC